MIRNCRWQPGCGAAVQPVLLNVTNDGQHDFGYPCFMPRQITVDGLVIDDRQHPKDYKGAYLFGDPDAGTASAKGRPFPYRQTEQVTLRNVTTTSGVKPRTSPNAAFNARVQVVEAGVETRTKILIGRGAARIEARVTVPEPHLWWPVGHGAQPQIGRAHV